MDCAAVLSYLVVLLQVTLVDIIEVYNALLLGRRVILVELLPNASFLECILDGLGVVAVVDMEGVLSSGSGSIDASLCSDWRRAQTVSNRFLVIFIGGLTLSLVVLVSLVAQLYAVEVMQLFLDHLTKLSR